MKKILMFVLAVALVPAVVLGAQLKGGNEYSLKEGELIPGNLYAGAGNLVIAGEVAGDAVIGGGNILLTGAVHGDVLGAGGTVDVLGDVDGDVRVAGGSVNIGGHIRGDVVIFGGEVRAISGAAIDGDVIVMSGKVYIDAPVRGTVRGFAGNVEINNRIDGDVRVKGDAIRINDQAVIAGSLVYTSKQQATISPSAQIQGSVEYTPAARVETKVFSEGAAAFSALWGIWKFASFMILGLILYAVFRKRVFALAEESLKIDMIGNNILSALIVYIGVPIILVACFVSIVGMLLGVIGLLTYALFLILVRTLAPIVLGVLLYERGLKAKNILSWHTVVVGGVLYSAIDIIPFVGTLIHVAVLIITGGVLARKYYLKIHSMKGV